MLTAHPAPATPGAVVKPVWIDLLQPTPEERDRIASEYGLRVPSREELQEIESSSRLRGGAAGMRSLEPPASRRPGADTQHAAHRAGGAGRPVTCSARVHSVPVPARERAFHRGTRLRGRARSPREGRCAAHGQYGRVRGPDREDGGLPRGPAREHERPSWRYIQTRVRPARPA